MAHGVELGIAVVVCVALAAGAALRWVARRTGVPYTVAMLLLGLAGGVGLKRWVLHLGDAPLALFGGDLPGVSPDLILFVFLPALVFESAFALDVHAFRRNLGTVAILAVPAMLLSTALVGLLAWQAVGPSWGWSLTAALVFGALISATDPVAVVAVLRELGAPKRLSLLVEGESLLNDGTAIVAFTVLAALLGPDAPEIDPLHTAARFAVVVAGGIAVGLALAWLASAWLGRTFNDPMVEITVTVVLAYAAMVVAEGLLHVSGVMAIVVAGLVMAGPGQTRISPEVRHFLHRFWEVLAFLANTLIFFLVGLAIAFSLEGAALGDLLIVALVYAGVIVVRSLVTLLFYPLLRRMPEPVRRSEAVVLAWGGLRGAVSLALALMLSQREELDPDLRHQVLRLTAGVVLLTILVNGTTTGWLLRRLGFVTPSPSELLTREAAMLRALEEVDARLEGVAADPDLSSLPWPRVRGGLRWRIRRLGDRVAALRGQLEREGGDAHRVEVWRQALRIEREAYWDSFADGVLGRVALGALLRAIDQHTDDLRAGRLTPPPRRAPRIGGLRSWLALRLRGLGLPFGAAERGRLTLRYDVAIAEAEAAGAVIAAFSDAEDEHETEVAAVYRGWRSAAKRGLADLRQNLPEVVAAIEERLAQRIALNLERERVKDAVRRGTLPEAMGEEARDHVEARMKALAHGPAEVGLPETTEVCRNTPLFRGLDEPTRALLSELTVEQAFEPGEALFEEGDEGDAVYVVVRGAFAVTRLEGDAERQLDVVSTGGVLGEMALLTGERRNATCRALSSAVVGRIERRQLEELMAEHVDVRARIWMEFARHALEDAVRADRRLRPLGRHARHVWLAGGRLEELEDGAPVHGPWTFVIQGAVRVDGGRVGAPRLLPIGAGEAVADGEAVVIALRDPPIEPGDDPRAEGRDR